MLEVNQKQEVIRSFDRAASAYRGLAKVQSKVAESLAAKIDKYVVPRSLVLDIGSGVGTLTELLCNNNPTIKVHALDASSRMLAKLPDIPAIKPVQSDFDQLPYEDGVFDLVVSNVALQWSVDPTDSLREWLRVLKPGGHMIFSTFTSGTLQEWADCWRLVDTYQHVNPLVPADVLETILYNLPCETLEIERDSEIVYHDNWHMALDSVRAVGANRLLPRNRRRGLMGRVAWQAFITAYEQLRDTRGLPLTYRVFNGIVQKK